MVAWHKIVELEMCNELPLLWFSPLNITRKMESEFLKNDYTAWKDVHYVEKFCIPTVWWIAEGEFILSIKELMDVKYNFLQ